MRHVVATLNAGKHVLCAVPAAYSLEECYKLKDAVLTSGLTYMMSETSYYRQNTISVRQFYKDGLFGNIFSAAAEYNHPGLDTLWFENGKPTWRHGMPPLMYPTHCTSFLINRSVLDIVGSLLVISQFTLHAKTRKGNRPSYIRAAQPDIAIPLYNRFVTRLSRLMGKEVGSGEFGAMMQIELVNDGPVTIIIDTKEKE